METWQITATIVTYKNDTEVLDKAVYSFLNTDLQVKMYLIDNSPTDELRAHYEGIPRVEYRFMNANRGFGAGHNVIMQDPLKLGKYHLVLNPDVYFTSGTLEKLYQFMEVHPEVGNVMPKIIYPDGRLQYLCKLLPRPQDWLVRMFVPLQRIRKKINYNLEMHFADYDCMMNVPYLSGCFMFLRKSVIEEVGLFDEGIFMYGEDTDLNRRIYKKYQTLYYPEVTIVHKFEKGSHKNLRLLWIHVKASIYYLNKWGWFWDKERKRINEEVKSKYTVTA